MDKDMDHTSSNSEILLQDINLTRVGDYGKQLCI